MKRARGIGCAMALLVLSGASIAKLPPVSDEARAKSAEAAAKAAWSDKVSLYKTCLAMDRVVSQYHRDAERGGKATPAVTPVPPCADPGPYAASVTPTSSKPIEASEAHSPAGNATSPPSTNATAAQLDRAKQ